jgi:hypothetical protein
MFTRLSKIFVIFALSSLGTSQISRAENPCNYTLDYIEFYRTSLKDIVTTSWSSIGSSTCKYPSSGVGITVQGFEGYYPEEITTAPIYSSRKTSIATINNSAYYGPVFDFGSQRLPSGMVKVCIYVAQTGNLKPPPLQDTCFTARFDDGDPEMQNAYNAKTGAQPLYLDAPAVQSIDPSINGNYTPLLFVQGYLSNKLNAAKSMNIMYGFNGDQNDYVLYQYLHSRAGTLGYAPGRFMLTMNDHSWNRVNTKNNYFALYRFANDIYPGAQLYRISPWLRIKPALPMSAPSTAASPATTISSAGYENILKNGCLSPYNYDQNLNAGRLAIRVKGAAAGKSYAIAVDGYPYLQNASATLNHEEIHALSKGSINPNILVTFTAPSNALASEEVLLTQGKTGYPLQTGSYTLRLLEIKPRGTASHYSMSHFIPVGKPFTLDILDRALYGNSECSVDPKDFSAVNFSGSCGMSVGLQTNNISCFFGPETDGNCPINFANATGVTGQVVSVAPPSLSFFSPLIKTCGVVDAQDNKLSCHASRFGTFDGCFLRASCTRPPACYELHNHENRYDVDKDTYISASDALTVINIVNSGVPFDPTFGGIYLPDVDGDCHVVASDALEIINYLNSH